MSTKIQNLKIDGSGSTYQDNTELLNELSDKELIDIFNSMFKTNHTVEELNDEEDYDPNWRKICINTIIKKLRRRFIENHPPSKIFPPAPTIKENSPLSLNEIKLKQLPENIQLKLRIQELERENQILRNYIQTMNNKLIPQKYNELETKHYKTNTSKLIVEGIPQRAHKTPAINEIKELQSNIPTPPKQLNKPIPYGESKAFKKSHDNMTFEQWCKLVGNSTDEKQMDLIKRTIENIRRSPLKWEIELYKFNDFGKEQLVKPLVDVLVNVVSKEMKADQKMLINYLIKQQWHSKPINYDGFNDLVKKIREHGFIFEVNEVSYDSSTTNIETILSIIDVIGINPVKIYKKVYSSNAGGFFPYWNLSNGIIDLSRYQILDKVNSYYNNRIHKIPCVFYAFDQLVRDGIISIGEIQQVALRCQNVKGDWTNNFYNTSDLMKLCEEQDSK